MESNATPANKIAQIRSDFDAGNYSAARKAAARLLDCDDEALAAQAQDLLDQMEPAPLVKYLLLLTGSLLIIVTLFAYAR